MKHDLDQFTISAAEFEPAYLRLHRRGELRARAEQALAALASCRVCPRDCGVNRLADESAVCHTGRYARVASCFAHFGEEDCLRGWRGSGTIFLSNCNLRCVFCQNFDISQQGAGRAVMAEELAAMMLELQSSGCHNINFVTPEHVVPQLLEALPLAVDGGLHLPLVYNTSAYDSPESLNLLDGIVDIYMPDFKIWNPRMALRYLKAKDYPQTARRALREMQRQVGDLLLDERGLAKRGLLVRHLVMPGLVADSRQIMAFLANEISRNTYLNLMAQYRPAGKVSDSKYEEINRPLRKREFERIEAEALTAGLWRLDRRAPSLRLALG